MVTIIAVVENIFKISTEKCKPEWTKCWNETNVIKQLSNRKKYRKNTENTTKDRQKFNIWKRKRKKEKKRKYIEKAKEKRLLSR